MFATRGFLRKQSDVAANLFSALKAFRVADKYKNSFGDLALLGVKEMNFASEGSDLRSSDTAFNAPKNWLPLMGVAYENLPCP